MVLITWRLSMIQKFISRWSWIWIWRIWVKDSSLHQENFRQNWTQIKQVHQEFKKYLEFGGRRYNSADRKISIPQENLKKVKALSTELGFEIVFTMKF